jgi:hypothetical protein
MTRSLLVVAALFLGLDAPSGLAAGAEGPSLAPTARAPETKTRAAPDTTFWPAGRNAVAAVGVAFPAGPERDPEGREGAAWVTAQALRAELSRRLGIAPSHVTVEVDRGFSSFVVQVPADQSERALRVLDEVILQDPVPRTTLEDVRVRVLSDLGFRAGAPTTAYRLELARFIHGFGSRWTNLPLGSRESVASLDPSEMNGVREAIYRRDEARWVVVRGPREGAPAPTEPTDSVNSPGAELPGRSPGDSLSSATPADSAAPGQPSAPAPEPWTPAWRVGDRLHITQEITNTWVAAAYPLDPSLTRTEQAFLLQALREELNPSPPDPGLFDSYVWVEASPRGPILVLEAAVFPEDADRWEARILDAVEGLAENPPEGAFFSFMARRQRTERALREADPGAMALWLLRDERGGDMGPVPTRNDLSRMASGLGEPRILVYGPDLGESQETP